MKRPCKSAFLITQLWLASSPLANAATRSIRGSHLDNNGSSTNSAALDETDRELRNTAIPPASENQAIESQDEEPLPQRRTRQKGGAIHHHAHTQDNADTIDGSANLIASPSSTNYDQLHRDEKAMLFPQTRIIGGNNAQVNEYPYAVSIQDENGHICGGTLIAVDTVLTAAHCSPMTMGKALKDIKVVVGRSDLSDKSAGEELSIRKEKIHTGYNRFDNDFALLFLRSATMMGKVIELNKEATDPEDLSLVIVVGWGDVDESENVRQMANVLQEANLKVVSNEQCNNSAGTVGTYQVSYKGFISDTMMCAWHRKRDSCQGDSGGPLMVRIDGGHKQVGLVSWGVGCKNRDFPGVYARVSSAFDWVEKQVCKNSIYPPRYLNCEPNEPF